MLSTFDLCGTNQRSFAPDSQDSRIVVLFASVGSEQDARKAARTVERDPSDSPAFRANDWAMRTNRGVL
jgi:hypothetical protein